VEDEAQRAAAEAREVIAEARAGGAPEYAGRVTAAVQQAAADLRRARNQRRIAVAAALLVGLVLGWQIRDIARSPHPRVRAIGALATSVPLFLAVFALTYFLMARIEPASFSERLSRLDAAYYTVTIFATVGFGDIVPVSGPARVATTVQMLGDLALVGLVARVLVGVVNQNLDRRK